MDPRVSACLQLDDADLEEHWKKLLRRLEQRFERPMTVESVLFLVGIQSSGRGYQPDLKRETKQDLIMEGTRCVFGATGLWTCTGRDSDGDRIWERTVDIPKLSVKAQEKLLRASIVSYFNKEMES